MNHDPLNMMSKIYIMFSTIYGNRFTEKSHSDPDFYEAWKKNMGFALRGIDPEFIKKAIQHCLMNCSWPPSIPEFREICEKQMGIPSFEQVFEWIERRVYTDAIVEWISNKITSYERSHYTQTQMKSAVKNHYISAIEQIRKEHQEIGLVGNESDYAELACQDNILHIAAS